MTSYQEADGATDGGLKGFSRFTSCLIPIIAALVLLAIGVTGINYLVDGEQARSPSGKPPSDAPDTADRAKAPVPEPAPNSRPEYSTDGILAVLTGLGWTQFGELAHYELGNRQRQTRKYRKDGAHLSVTIHTFESDRAAKRDADRLGAAPRQLRFGHKIVVIEALNDAAKPAIPGLIERLEKYRAMVQQ